MGTRVRKGKNTRSEAVFKEPPKAKQVSGDKVKLKKLAELKKVTKQIDDRFKAEQKKFEKRDKLFDKQSKLRQQLGIER